MIVASIATLSPACADEYPVRPITLVVPFPAGSASDVVARILSPGLAEVLKKQVVVENVAGAGGTTGAVRVARAAPSFERPGAPVGEARLLATLKARLATR